MHFSICVFSSFCCQIIPAVPELGIKSRALVTLDWGFLYTTSNSLTAEVDALISSFFRSNYPPVPALSLTIADRTPRSAHLPPSPRKTPAADFPLPHSPLLSLMTAAAEFSLLHPCTLPPNIATADVSLLRAPPLPSRTPAADSLPDPLLARILKCGLIFRCFSRST